MTDEDPKHPDDLIREALELGRNLTEHELGIVIRHVAQAGFDNFNLERARGRLAGIVWNGKVLRSNNMIRPAVAHFLRHVTYRPEWPMGTDLDDYLRSLSDVIEDARSGIAVGRYLGTEQLTIVRQSFDLQGPSGFPWILVDYRVATGHWVTAYQPADGLAVLESPTRSDFRWLRHPQ